MTKNEQNSKHKIINSHYVPVQTLKRFGETLCLFNVQTGEYSENVPIKTAFSKKGFYSNEIEEKLNLKIESQFGRLFAEKLVKCEKVVELSRKELRIVKKFLLISVIRSMGSGPFLENEKHYYEQLRAEWFRYAKQMGVSQSEAEKNVPKAPFEEKQIDGETAFDYWMRTLDVILSSDGSPEAILKNPNKTYPAYRWSQVINSGYLAFWDSSFDKNEYVITDVGMTSENEVGWNGFSNFNRKKTDFLKDLLENEKDDLMKKEIFKCLSMHSYFTENFMMFPISAKRMIVEIDPFYKFRHYYRNRYQMPKLEGLTEMVNEQLFEPNDCKYVLPQEGLEHKYDDGDKYIYEIKKLTDKETIYCNELFLDRIENHLGFSSLGKVAKSLIIYKKRNSFPYVPRKDYKELYDLINERFQGSLDLSTILLNR